MPSRVIPGFLPSTSGLHFDNSFPRVPLRYLGVPGVFRISLGDASDGLCGGMVFAARDYFEAGRAPPAETSPPAEGPMFDYLVDRLFDSFNLPLGPLRYVELMNPALPDGDPFLRWLGVGPHGRAWRMINEEWPKIREDIDAGRPSPLGLVKVKSLNPMELGKNHQVLAYGYETSEGRLTVRIYDPNHADRDDVTLALDVSSPRRGTTVTQLPGGSRIHSFFRVPYSPSSPP